MKIFKGGGEDVDFDYFYNSEAERFNFLKVPEIWVDGEEFKGLSAETTAKWEMELSEIAQGKSSKEEFLKDIENEIKEAVLTYRK